MQIDAVPQISKDKKRKGKGKGKMKTSGDKGQRGQNKESEGAVICIHFGRKGHYQCGCWYTIRSDDRNRRVSSVSQSIEPSTAAQLQYSKAHMETSRASCEGKSHVGTSVSQSLGGAAPRSILRSSTFAKQLKPRTVITPEHHFQSAGAHGKSNTVTESHISPSKLDLACFASRHRC